ncbi:MULTISPECIES: mechanosensitive ion channel family protein [Sinorhizobium/Ensifer group]|uniref:mechanosensitive ion channel family protein n=1 Tax=Sinorhizobium/Ensifer group TaxID=227292 RepID=UPI00070E6655|nr:MULTISPECIES: mechanosensitive ion channel domain-containing protein [Sinorhizobium/Ensifer group]KRD52920.1 mechanosensitive ion channel protein [Ensifer sp. Root278]KSV77004.1 mechanosensitive ion channel protein [Sinorhizobium sp. Sb3]KSV93814.1 mechanosensitive ion channel protein [Sinorhizobium sp. GL28]MBD9507393.1 mechanosensitive ion channel family protein [Ensifer sp. ENS10]MBV7517631.1 mechanosensitive ion channel [Ensifer sp. ENS12]
MDFAEAFDAVASSSRTVLLNEWTYYQIAIIVAGYLICGALAKRIEPLVEARARLIKGNPDLLRVIIAFMRRLRWLFLIVWLWIADGMILRFGWPSYRWLVATALTLTAAWFVISVLTRIIRNQTLARVTAVVGWIYFALYAVGLDRVILTTLDGVAVNLGAVRLSLLLVLKAVVLSSALIWLAVLLGNVSAHWIQRSAELTPSFKVLISKLVKIVLIGFAGAIALSATGIDLTALTVFSGAVGVGIGFGLQKVVSNFISGIIILLDKSIKPGDTITLGDTFGSVRDLRSRFVSVITRDGKEYLIPNEDFISQQVVNWSFSSDFVRIEVSFGTSYDSDPHEVARIAIAAAKSIPRVASGHAEPVCWMTGFGASSLDFKLRFWISDPSNGLTNIRGQVMMALWDAFKVAGISIPFPHREIIMKTPIEVTRA